MRITCERSYLAMALGVAGRAVSSRNTLPILSNVLLETEDDRLKLTATDLDTAIRCVIPASIAENGSVAVPSGILSDVVSKLPELCRYQWPPHQKKSAPRPSSPAPRKSSRP